MKASIQEKVARNELTMQMRHKLIKKVHVMQSLLYTDGSNNDTDTSSVCFINIRK